MTLQEHINRSVSRQDSFNKMIEHVRNIENPIIVETGCINYVDDYAAGYSTVIFDIFINEHGGEFHSVDISEENINTSKKLVSEKTQFHCCDSVSFLHQFSTNLENMNKKIDLLYLDSYNYFPGMEHESSLHHVYELLAASSAIGTNTMIAVDDNFGDKGKGLYVKQYFDKLGLERVYSGYQWIWIIS